MVFCPSYLRSTCHWVTILNVIRPVLPAITLCKGMEKSWRTTDRNTYRLARTYPLWSSGTIYCTVHLLPSPSPPIVWIFCYGKVNMSGIRKGWLMIKSALLSRPERHWPTKGRLLKLFKLNWMISLIGFQWSTILCRKSICVKEEMPLSWQWL